jgi:hypothetical protein
VSAIFRKSCSLEIVLTNIATQLGIRNIVCEFDESTGIYTLDGDIKELGKLQDVLIHYYDENLDFNLENVSPNSKVVSPGDVSSEKKDQNVACNVSQTLLTKSKSGRLLKAKTGVGSFDENDVAYDDDDDDDDDEEYIPTYRNKRPSFKRKKEPMKKLRELILEFPEKTNTAVESGNMSSIPVDNFTSILGPVTQTGDPGSSSLKFEVQQSLLVTTKLETQNLKEEDMPAQSNEDVVSLLEKPLEGDDVRKFINITNISGVVQEASVEAEDFVSKFVNMDTNDLLGDGTSDLGGEVEKTEVKTTLDLPPVTLSDEEAMEALEREEVEEKIRGTLAVFKIVIFAICHRLYPGFGLRPNTLET